MGKFKDRTRYFQRQQRMITVDASQYLRQLQQAQAMEDRMRTLVAECGGRFGSGAFCDEVIFNSNADALEYERRFKVEFMS